MYAIRPAALSFEGIAFAVYCPPNDSRVLRKGTPRTPPGPEGSNGTGQFPVPQVRLAIIRWA
jgi:hypothetical protein